MISRKIAILSSFTKHVQRDYRKLNNKNVISDTANMEMLGIILLSHNFRDGLRRKYKLQEAFTHRVSFASTQVSASRLGVRVRIQSGRLENLSILRSRIVFYGLLEVEISPWHWWRGQDDLIVMEFYFRCKVVECLTGIRLVREWVENFIGSQWWNDWTRP